MLLGFFRYRLGFENVSINRNTVYTSIVITFGGVIFSGVGLFAYIFRFFNIHRSYFEKSLFVVAFIAFAIVIIGSGSIRRWIIEFVSSRFYSTKYDYREQFFHLYKTYVNGINLDESLTNMVENMKYAVAAIDAFVFCKSAHNNSYVMHRNPEYSTAERVVILGNEFPDSVFWVDCAPIYLGKKNDSKREKIALVMNIPIIKKLSPSVIFPIYNDKELLGLLMIKLSEGRVLDQEDIALINVFTHSIGTVFYRNILANEKIEQEQFQSFHQVVSFVIHDIKNQIATLSLLARNATEYITDQDFQKSLIRSIKNSAENLTSLVTKLTEQRNAAKLKINETALVPIVESAIEQTNLHLFPEIEFLWELKESCTASVDADVMKSVVVNIIKNAIEAMSSHGKLIMSIGKGSSFKPINLERFGLAQGELSGERVLLVVEDTGVGMSQDFIDNGLFKPFVSTKDKGMGIGLYQCKVSIERMGGRIYCYSKLGAGTAFCVMV
jgi:putative PEP-CTERM system histidine kinase